MRKFLLIMVLFISFDGKAQSIYYPLPDSNAIWVHNTACKQIITVKGDSTIGSFVYKKYFSVSSMTLSTSTYDLVGLIRQDIPSKKVFGIKAGTPTERLLYNFNLNINDTIRVFSIDWMSGWLVSPGFKLKVEQKDSLLINGQYRTRLKLKCMDLSPSFQEEWIEGIGSKYGVLNSGGGACAIVIDGCNPILNCMTQNSNLLYPISGSFACGPINCPLSAKEFTQKNKIRIIPNPASDQIIIENSDGKSFVSIKIINSIGELVYSKEIFNNKEPDLIQVSDYPNGIYIIKLIDEDLKTFTQKLIVE